MIAFKHYNHISDTVTAFKSMTITNAFGFTTRGCLTVFGCYSCLVFLLCDVKSENKRVVRKLSHQRKGPQQTIVLIMCLCFNLLQRVAFSRRAGGTMRILQSLLSPLFQSSIVSLYCKSVRQPRLLSLHGLQRISSMNCHHDAW